MQAAQIIGGFSLGKADVLRRAMGKKKIEEMREMKDEFVNGALERSIDKNKAEQVFEIMEKFASYGFNRSHSAAYSILAFQTAYLKANYPAEYMAAVLTNNMHDIKQVNFFLRECKRLKVPALGPDINESGVKFVVNKSGEIRFSLTAVKGVGTIAVSEIVRECKEDGPYTNLFDLTKRVNLKTVNKKCLESLANAGAFDCFSDMGRADYFGRYPADQLTVIEKSIQLGNLYHKEQQYSQNSLFGDSLPLNVDIPKIPETDPWDPMEMLKKEKEYTGIYLSGHPLDAYKIEIDNFVNCTMHQLPEARNQDVAVAGIVTVVSHKVGKNNKSMGFFTVEDFEGAAEFALFSEDYLKFKHFLNEGEHLYIKGRYQLRYNSRDRYDFKISSIELLGEIKAKMTSEITVNLPISEVTDDLIQEMEQLFQANKGQLSIKLKLHDLTDRNYVDLFSSKYKVSLNNHLTEFFDRHDSLRYELSAVRN